MLHEFKAGTLDAAKCVHCKRTTEQHACDICGKENVAVQVKFGNMLMCGPCTADEERLYAESQKPENVAQRVASVNAEANKAAELNDVIKAARITDDSIEIRTDLFNAATTAIVDLKKAIDDDVNITNKPYALAEELKKRFEHHRDVIFEMQKSIVEAGNEQRAIQTYLNQLANQLKQEEREKLKIQDMNYQPKPVKPAKPAAISTTGTKKTRGSKVLDKVELRKYAAELGVGEYTLQMIVVSKGITIPEAAKMLKSVMEQQKTQ